MKTENKTMSSFLLGLEDFGFEYPTNKPNTFGIKFISKREVARKVWTDFSVEYPELKSGLMYHECSNKGLIIFGGAFPSNSKAKDILFRLIKKNLAS